MALDILTIDIGRTINHSKTSKFDEISERIDRTLVSFIESRVKYDWWHEERTRFRVDSSAGRSMTNDLDRIQRWRCLKSFGRDSPWRLFSLALWIATISVVNFDFRSEGELSFLFHRNLREKMNDRYLSVHRSNEQTFPFLGVDPRSLSRWRPLRRRILKVD